MAELDPETVDLQALDTDYLETRGRWAFQEDFEAIQVVHVTLHAPADDQWNHTVEVARSRLIVVKTFDTNWVYDLDAIDGDVYTLGEGLKALQKQFEAWEVDGHMVDTALLLERVSVHPDLRGRGLGRRTLLAAVEAQSFFANESTLVLTYPMPDEVLDSRDESERSHAVAELVGRLGIDWHETGHPGVVWALSQDIARPMD